MSSVIFLIIICLFNCIAAIPVFPQEQEQGIRQNAHKKWEIEARGEYDSGEGNSSMLKAGDIRYSMSVMDFEKDGKTIFNISTPYAVFGKVAGKGLLREIRNPAAHSPGSSVFREKTEVAADKSFKSTGNSGIRLSSGEAFSVFNEMSTSESGTLDWSGAYGRYKIRKWLDVSCAAAKYKEKDDSLSDSWYTERRTGYGREVVNTAFSASAGVSPAGAGAAAALTSCHGTHPGLFYRFSPYLALFFIRIDLLFSGTNDSYIKPEGSLSSKALRKGALLSLYPLDFLKLTGRYISDIYHEKLSDKNYGSNSEEKSASILFDPVFLILGAGISDKNNFSSDTNEEGRDIYFTGGLKSRCCKAVLEKKGRYRNSEKYCDSLRLEAGVRNRFMNIYILGKLIKQESTEKSVKTRITVYGSEISVFGEYSASVLNEAAGRTESSYEYSTGFTAKY